MAAIGEMLRRERVRRNLELQQISQELKISARFLDAIEREAFDELPGAVFARSFVRQYARHLGLDEEELAAETQRIMEPVVVEPPAKVHAALPANNVRVPPMQKWGSVGDGGRFRWSSTLPALGLVVAVTLVCSGIYAWWQRERHSAPVSTAQTVTPAPQVAPPVVVPPPAASAVDTTPDAAAGQTPPAQPDTSATLPPASAAANRQSGETPADTPVPAPRPAVAAQPVAGVPAATSTGPVRVQVTAIETTWVRARSDGKFAFSVTLDANQTRTVEASESVELLLGNAGGVSVLLNGKPVGPLGPKGQVRTLQFNSGGFKAVSVKAPAPDPL